MTRNRKKLLCLACVLDVQHCGPSFWNTTGAPIGDDIGANIDDLGQLGNAACDLYGLF